MAVKEPGCGLTWGECACVPGNGSRTDAPEVLGSTLQPEPPSAGSRASAHTLLSGWRGPGLLSGGENGVLQLSLSKLGGRRPYEDNMQRTIVYGF